MSSVIVMNIRRWEQLDDAHAAKVKEELARLDVDVTVPSWSSRVRVGPDNRLFLVVRAPAFPLSEAGQPGGERYLLETERILAPTEALQLLRGDPAQNPETEVHRRRRHVEELEAQMENERRQRAEREAAAAAQSAERRRRERELQKEVWDAMPAWARFAFKLAMLEKDPDRAAALRSLGAEVMAQTPDSASIEQAKQWGEPNLGWRLKERAADIGPAFPDAEWRW